MKCERHMDGRYEDAECPICKLEVELAGVFGSFSPRYRYFEVNRPRFHYTFEWTTETADQGRYWAVKRKWTKGRGVIVQKVGFKQRNKAKARALAWYTKARTPVTA